MILRHKPSGLVVRCENERSQKRNKDSALSILTARLNQIEQTQRQSKEAAERKNQVGSGQRGDKRRTIRAQDGIVTDHVIGRKWRYADYVRGIW